MSGMAYMCKNRHGTYYARFIIPKQLQPHFKNKREIRRSLQTDSRKLAVRRARVYRVQFESVIDELMSKADNTSEKARQIIDSLLADKTKRQQDAEDTFVAGMGKPLPPVESGKSRMQLITILEELGGNRVITIDNPTPEETRALEVYAAVQQTPKSVSAKPVGKTVAEYLDEYIAHKMTPGKKGSWSAGTARQKPNKLNTFKTVFGDKVSAGLIREDMEHYINIAYVIPAHFNNPDHQKNKFKGITLDMILDNVVEIEALDFEIRGLGTIRDDLKTVVAFLRWVAKRRDIDLRAPINALNNEIFDIDYESKKRAFTDEELLQLFIDDNPSPENYVKGFSKPVCFFIPLIALYSGARLAEICQLHLDDIKQVKALTSDQYHWVIDINDDADKQLKNKHSRRQVPIHKALIDAGLLIYADKLMAEGEIKLFPGVNRTGSYQFVSQSSWFADYSDKSGVTDKETSFHSFRHCFAKYLNDRHTPEDIVIALTGHQFNSQAKSTYDRNRNRDVGQLAEAVDNIDYGLNHPPFRFD